MIKELRVDSVSYKKRALKLGGRWVDVEPTFQLDQARIGEVYRFEILDTFEQKKIVSRIVPEA